MSIVMPWRVEHTFKSPESHSNGGEQIQCNTERNHTGIHERFFFGHLSASGGRKSHRKRQWATKSYVSNAKYTQLSVECTWWLLNIFNDHLHIKKNDLVLLLYLLSNVARLKILSPLPRTMFFSNDIRQLQNRKPSEALDTSSHLLEGKF